MVVLKLVAMNRLENNPWIYIYDRIKLPIYSKSEFIYIYMTESIRTRSLVVSDLRSENNGFRFESGC